MVREREKLERVALTLAERMILTRRRMKITQDELAALLGVSRKTISRIEVGMTVKRSTRDRFHILEQRHIKTGSRSKVKVPAPI